jgi:hypothetical protein
MERLYRQHVLKEPSVPVLQIQGLKKATTPEEHTTVH